MGGYFPVLGPTPKGEDHEGTLIDYYRYRFDAQHRRIRPIAKRAAEKQSTHRGPKSDQFKFVGASGVLVDIFAEFDALHAEPVDAFRNRLYDDQPVGQQRGAGPLAGSIRPTVEFPCAGQYGSAGKYQSDPVIAHRHQQRRHSAVYQYSGSALEQPDQYGSSAVDQPNQYSGSAVD
jgi:hypothetical protein